MMFFFPLSVFTVLSTTGCLQTDSLDSTDKGRESPVASRTLVHTEANRVDFRAVSQNSVTGNPDVLVTLENNSDQTLLAVEPIEHLAIRLESDEALQGVVIAEPAVYGTEIIRLTPGGAVTRRISLASFLDVASMKEGSYLIRFVYDDTFVNERYRRRGQLEQSTVGPAESSDFVLTIRNNGLPLLQSCE
jgi:hypothetical protein